MTKSATTYLTPTFGAHIVGDVPFGQARNAGGQMEAMLC